MSITFNSEIKLSVDDKFTINWLNEHNIKGYLDSKKGDTSIFCLRKTGMTTYFACTIDYKEIDVTAYLKHLDKALDERVEQEENAKQCVILARRIKHLLGLDEMFLDTFIDCLDELENYIDITVTREILKLRREYHRLYPKQAHTYKDGLALSYAQHSEGFSYWDEFMYNPEIWRFGIRYYIPVYEED